MLKKYALVFLTLLVFICATMVQCGRQYKDPYADVPVNKDFARDPPIATNIQISLLKEPLESGNLLYEATLPREKIKNDMLALFVGDSNKIVLHDDGQNGDKIAGDGIFSTVMNINIDSLTLLMHDQLVSAQQLLDPKTPVFKFSGRLEFPFSKEELQKTFTTEILKAGPAALLKTSFKLFPFPQLLPVGPVFKRSSLTVIDPAVINDPSRTFDPCANTGTPGGAWTFGKLMTDMANTPVSGIAPADFVLHWLNTWKSDQTVNSDDITARPGIDTIIKVWHILCGGDAAPLDVNKAPFKLLAIVNRFDLRSGGAYGGGDAGEGRFVFIATDRNCQPLVDQFAPGHFLAIFEYGVNKTTCSSIHAYAQQWADLQAMTVGTPAYNSALQAITDQFTTANTNSSKPNNNSLDQLRTNEFAIGAGPWELREFHIDATTHQLFNVTVKREPNAVYNGTGNPDGPPGDPQGLVAFGNFVNANAAMVIADKMDLPNTIVVAGSPKPFIGAKAHLEDAVVFHWDAVIDPGPGHITNDTARMHISLNTCSGCHGGESKTGTFTHVNLLGGTIHLSPFLTGLVQNPGDPVVYSSLPFFVSDPASRPSAAHPIQWPFNDLERRGRDLNDFIGSPCFVLPPIERNIRVSILLPLELSKQLRFSPLTMTD